MQNVLKNLISGLMLLFERPFSRVTSSVGTARAGGNITGDRHPFLDDSRRNGVDFTLIPQQPLRRAERHQLDLRQPEGCASASASASPTVRRCDVAELLAACVARHGLVLEDPGRKSCSRISAPTRWSSASISARHRPQRDRSPASAATCASSSKGADRKGIVISTRSAMLHLDAAALKIELVGVEMPAGN